MITENEKKSGSGNAASVQEEPTGLVCNHPMASALVVFGIGLGAGVALTSLLSGSHSSRPVLGPRSALVAEQLGRQIQDAIVGVIPPSLAKYIAA